MGHRIQTNLRVPAFILAGCIAPALSACRKTPPPPNIDTVVLISIDTCRADRLSCYGFEKNTTPVIDALARESRRFEQVIAPAPITLPSHASMLTGTIPPTHGVHGNGTFRLHDDFLTLAEILKEHGFSTAAAVGAFVMHAQFGLAQGFDMYDYAVPNPAGRQQILSTRNAEAVTDAAIRVASQTSATRRFLFVHYYDPHFPYEPPEPYATQFKEDPYAGEIAYTDAQVGRLFDTLKHRGLWDNALVIVTSDHGEALGGHGEATHGYFVYHDTTRIPLIIRMPGESPGVIKTKVALIDVAPTILAALDIPVPESMQGKNLLDIADREGEENAVENEVIYSESFMPTNYDCSPLVAVETPAWKYIHTTRPELYHLASDPDESRNRIADEPRRAKHFRARLETLLEEAGRDREVDAANRPDSTALARLESLGYVGIGNVDLPDILESGWEDPKDFLHYYKGLVMASDLSFRDPTVPIEFPGPDGPVEVLPREAARRICQRIVTNRPDIKKAHAILGRMAMEQHDPAQAIQHFSRLLELDPASAAAHHDLGSAYANAGNLDQARHHYEAALQIFGTEPADDAGGDTLLRKLGRLDPAWFESQAGLADVLFKSRDYDPAISAYQRLLEMDALSAGTRSLDNARVLANYRLGVMYAALSRIDEAKEAWLRVVRFHEDHPLAKRANQALDQLGDD